MAFYSKIDPRQPHRLSPQRQQQEAGLAQLLLLAQTRPRQAAAILRQNPALMFQLQEHQSPPPPRGQAQYRKD
jgi:hypothetical protein